MGWKNIQSSGKAVTLKYDFGLPAIASGSGGPNRVIIFNDTTTTVSGDLSVGTRVTLTPVNVTDGDNRTFTDTNGKVEGFGSKGVGGFVSLPAGGHAVFTVLKDNNTTTRSDVNDEIYFNNNVLESSHGTSAQSTRPNEFVYIAFAGIS